MSTRVIHIRVFQGRCRFPFHADRLHAERLSVPATFSLSELQVMTARLLVPDVEVVVTREDTVDSEVVSSETINNNRKEEN